METFDLSDCMKTVTKFDGAVSSSTCTIDTAGAVWPYDWNDWIDWYQQSYDEIEEIEYYENGNVKRIKYQYGKRVKRSPYGPPYIVTCEHGTTESGGNWTVCNG